MEREIKVAGTLMTDGDIDNLNEEALEELEKLWKFLHKFVELTRYSGELKHPRLYKAYDNLCKSFNEVPRKVDIDLEDL